MSKPKQKPLKTHWPSNQERLKQWHKKRVLMQVLRASNAPPITIYKA